MKKVYIFLVFSFFVLFPFSSIAVTCRDNYNDDYFCEKQGYNLEKGNGCQPRICVFPDGSKCSSDTFLHGTCGVEFRKPTSCVENGHIVQGYEVCCNGKKLLNYGAGEYSGYATCESFLTYPYKNLPSNTRVIISQAIFFIALFSGLFIIGFFIKKLFKKK
ncbi:MAG: hypothetical protein COY69_02710 [Candidatus Magasanikbacteria bacterium CG_4_10_14_0_8_um_filter_32_14]|uniref:Transmembrane protein n=2 Tax=Candidatus Magasanikiibacteriota TaxID=1752731 RepID=A0A2M7RA49_9BACT|nr:MAG: hypothetical protein AUJ23_03760 [Candidatus Magasanikbacteria bacterium CG1_02_32_51]PIY93236.1 MAG: hypothetical protein COY69_02710 [Candidatus Magasanikbacteria bacterium CG_4_10_14_0_8_um_filter_32_14]